MLISRSGKESNKNSNLKLKILLFYEKNLIFNKSYKRKTITLTISQCGEYRGKVI